MAEQEEKSRVNEEVNLDSNQNQQRNRKRTRDNISKSRLDASFSFATAMSMPMPQTNDEEAEANSREGEDLDAGLESQLADNSVYSVRERFILCFRAHMKRVHESFGFIHFSLKTLFL